LVDGLAALYLDRGGSSLQILPAAADPDVAAAALQGLGSLVADGRLRELTVTRVDGRPVGESPLRETLLATGFVPAYRGLVLRTRRAMAAARRARPAHPGSAGRGRRLLRRAGARAVRDAGRGDPSRPLTPGTGHPRPDLRARRARRGPPPASGIRGGQSDDC